MKITATQLIVLMSLDTNYQLMNKSHKYTCIARADFDTTIRELEELELVDINGYRVKLTNLGEDVVTAGVEYHHDLGIYLTLRSNFSHTESFLFNK